MKRPDRLESINGGDLRPVYDPEDFVPWVPPGPSPKIVSAVRRRRKEILEENQLKALDFLFGCP